MKTPKEARAAIATWLQGHPPRTQWAILLTVAAARLALTELNRVQERRRIAEEVANALEERRRERLRDGAHRTVNADW